jgi:DNA-directed RNA polymerase specialized sigma24 family protein
VLKKSAPAHTQESVARATPAELESLYRSRFEHFVRLAAAVCGDAEAGRDAVQNAFATAVRETRSFRGEGPLEAWVWRIVVNEARRLARQRRPMVGVAAAEPAANGEGDDPLGVRAFVATLPERQREVLFLRYYADLDYRTIAAVLGIEPGTVAATLSTAHGTLRARLEAIRR